MFADTITVGCELVQMAQLAVAQRIGQLGLQDGVGTGRAAAQMGFVLRHLHVETQRAQVHFDTAAQLLAMLQRARRMVGDTPRGALTRPFNVGTRSGKSSLKSRVSALIRSAFAA